MAMQRIHYITALRFPLALLIVFIHSYNSVWRGLESGSFPTLPYFCSRIFPTFAVPLFFAISGYLFFLNTSKLDIKTYSNKLKRRFHTLFLPYLIWNLIAFGLYAAQDYAAHLPLSFPPSANCLWGCHSLGQSHTNFFGQTIYSGTAPILEPLWFVRDLLIIILCSPLIYTLIRYLKFFGLLALGIIFYLDLWPNFGGITLTGFWYFALGAWFSLTHRDPAQSTHWLPVPALTLMFPLSAFLMLYPDFNPIVRTSAQQLYILCGMIVSIQAARLYCKFITPGKFLAQSSFFVYASHTIVLLPLSMLMARMAGQTDAINQALLFFVLPFGATLICTLGFALLQRLTPRYHYLLTGVQSL